MFAYKVHKELVTSQGPADGKVFFLKEYMELLKLYVEKY